MTVRNTDQLPVRILERPERGTVLLSLEALHYCGLDFLGRHRIDITSFIRFDPPQGFLSPDLLILFFGEVVKTFQQSLSEARSFVDRQRKQLLRQSFEVFHENILSEESMLR